MLNQKSSIATVSQRAATASSTRSNDYGVASEAACIKSESSHYVEKHGFGTRACTRVRGKPDSSLGHASWEVWIPNLGIVSESVDSELGLQNRFRISRIMAAMDIDHKLALVVGPTGAGIVPKRAPWRSKLIVKPRVSLGPRCIAYGVPESGNSGMFMGPKNCHRKAIPTTVPESGKPLVRWQHGVPDRLFPDFVIA